MASTSSNLASKPARRANDGAEIRVVSRWRRPASGGAKVAPACVVRIFDTVDTLGRAMTYHRERHAVLATNVANLDTPGFKPMDLVRVEDAASQAPALSTTDARHMQSEATGTIREELVTEPGEVSGRDGNEVVLERELAKINANRVQYSASSEVVSRRLAMLRYAASDGTT